MLLELLKSNDYEAIQKEISARFVKNMEYFHKTSPELFDALKEDPTQYNLLINKQGINIINLATSELSYPLQDSLSTMVSVNENLSLSPLKNDKWSIHSNGIFLDKMDTTRFPITGQTCNDFIDLLFKHDGIKEYFLSKDFMPSTCIFGLLGGMFLEFIIERGVFFHSLLIFEENLDMFRVSCYFVDYPRLFSQVSDGACYLFVKDLVNRFFIRNFFARQKITNNFLRAEINLYKSPKIESAMQIVAEEYASNARGWGSFEDEMIGIENTLKNVANIKPNERKKKPNLFLVNPKRVDMPICVVGNGASLDSSLDFLREHQSKMIIFSCGTAIKPLKQAGIQPDFQIEIERVDYLAEYLSPTLGETALMCGNMVNPNALNLASEKYLFMRGGSASGYMFKSPFVMEFCAPFVGNAGFALACQLGNEVLLCGIDCGYIKGRTKHASNSAYGEEEATIPSNAIRVRGNFDHEVYSDSIFLLSSQMITNAIKALKPKMVLNLSEGAYIEGARPTRTNEFSLKKNKKSAFIKEIKSYFKNDKKLIFSDFREDFYLQEIQEFKSKLSNALNAEVKTKQELFKWVDMIFAINAKKSVSSPFVGILFEGSLAHICQNLMIAVLHLPNNDISAFFTEAKDSIKNALDKILLRYKMLASKYQN
ncbi:motility associated factor glycosyltransferase family protein [Helicobacter sp. T3_23-1059]